jgi:hypothetical protein
MTWNKRFCAWCGKPVEKVYKDFYCSEDCIGKMEEERVKITNNPELKGNKVFLGCPMTPEKNWIIPDYLGSLVAQEFPKKDIHIGFLINYPEDDNRNAAELAMILETFKSQFEDKYHKIDVWEYETNFEESKRIHHRSFAAFSEIRNAWLEMRDKAIDGDRYIFSVDSDILLPPYALKRLMSWIKNNNYDAVSSMISNGPTADGQEAFNFMSEIKNEIHDSGGRVYIHRPPGVLEVHSNWSATPDKDGFYNLTGLIEVPMTGAAILYKREIADAGVNYGYHFQGEDIHWSEAARRAGFRLYCDFSTHSQHVMNPAVLQQMKQPGVGKVVSVPIMDGHLIPPKTKPKLRLKHKW